VLDAVVTGPWQREVDEERPDRRLGLSWKRPLHLGLNDALPTTPEVPMNYLAAVVRGRVGTSSRVGGMATLATPLIGECPGRPDACLAQGGNAAAVDFDLKTSDGGYGVFGQLSASQTVGGLPERTLRDGTVLRRGDLGLGGYVRAGRFGGEGMRWELGDDFATPRLELNPSGFQLTQNQHAPRAALRYRRNNGMGPLKSFVSNLSVGTKWTTDGRGLNRGTFVNFDATAQLPSFDFVGMEAGANFGGWDVRELRGSGVALQGPSSGFLVLTADSNANRPLSAGGYAVAGHFLRAGPIASAWDWQVSLYGSARPHPALETRLEVLLDRTIGPRFIGALGSDRFLVGRLLSESLSMTLRQQWVVTPRLTLQAYAQLFTGYAAYGPFFEGTSDASRTPIRFDALVPVARESEEDFHDVGLNLNVVLRWEYRLGSTLYVVYTRGQQRFPVEDGLPPPHTLLPEGLSSGPAQDALLVKWSWYWDA
jgi:hypothetical protein